MTCYIEDFNCCNLNYFLICRLSKKKLMQLYSCSLSQTGTAVYLHVAFLQTINY